MSGRLIFETKFGVGSTMTNRDRNEAWDELRRLVGAGQPARQKPRDFWEEIFGSEDALLYDGEGNDRVAYDRPVAQLPSGHWGDQDQEILYPLMHPNCFE